MGVFYFCNRGYGLKIIKALEILGFKEVKIYWLHWLQKFLKNVTV